MRQRPTKFWLLTLPQELSKEIEQNLPDNSRISKIDAVEEISLDHPDPLEASIVFVTPETFKVMSNKGGKSIIEHHNIQQVLIIDDQSSLDRADINQMGSFLGIIRRPVTRKDLQDIRDKAVEIQELYTDLHLMAKEISLDRELLARKNVQLEFLNRILTRSSSSLNVEEILSIARQEFSEFTQASGLAAIFWKNNEQKELSAEMYLPVIEDRDHASKWKEALLTVPGRFTQREVSSYKEISISRKFNVITGDPNPLRQLLIPLFINNKAFGAIMVIAENNLKLGRDQLQIVNNAGNHLALALRNALKYRDLKKEADFDGLTSVYNRQQFDKKMRVELKRHQRHAKPLSLIMLDLDYFKNLNDTYGHVAGDMVLKKIGYLLGNTVRETDFPARYGGEEFVVLLPETTEDQAWLLAERLRQKISRTNFFHENKNFNVTASIGVASLKPGPLTPGDTLVDQADQALYLAKNSGRNMVCTSADLCVGESISV